MLTRLRSKKMTNSKEDQPDDGATGGTELSKQQLIEDRDMYKQLTEDLRNDMRELERQLMERRKQPPPVDWERIQHQNQITENLKAERDAYKQTAEEMKSLVEGMQQKVHVNQTAPNAPAPQQLQSAYSSPAQRSESTKFRVPTFYKANPKAWFSILELAFEQNRITDDGEKFRQVLINIDPLVIDIVQDLMDNPPMTQKYNTLKKRIVDALAESSETKLRKVLQGSHIGTDKPSVYLYRIKSLAEGNCSEAVLKSIFIDGMPERIKSVLVATETQDLTKLAVIADRVWEVSSREVQAIANLACQSDLDVAAVQFSPRNSVDTRLSNLEKGLSQIQNSLKQIFDKVNKMNRHRSSSGNRNSVNSDNMVQTDRSVCKYHRKFGEQAWRCIQPCRMVFKADVVNNPEN